jgi:glycosyltransferase involved in cell wall biosynthesis
MKVYINRIPVNGPWGGGNIFVSAFHKRAPDLCELLLDQTGNVNPDVILLAGLDNDGHGISVDQAVMYKLYVKPDCKIVLRVNENDARKDTSHMDPMLLKVSAHIDGTVFVSNWLQQYFNDKGWACKDQTVIVNGVAADVFKPQPKLNNGKLNVVAHHWSSHYMKGADIYEKIDQLVGEHPDKFAFTYIGRHECSFKHTNVVKPLAGRALGEELGKHDVYVSASRFDPGPNHVLEALSCGLPTYVHKDGGGCVEFAGQDHAYRNWDDLKAILTARVETPSQFVQQGPLLHGWQPCIQDYVSYLERVMNA